MKNFLYLIITISILSSCSIKEEMWLNEDGSGKVEYTFDMSKMMSEMGGMFGNMMGEDIGSKIIEEEEESTENNAQSIDDLFDPSNEESVDTTVNFLEIMPDSVKATQSDLEDFEKINMKIKTNKDSKEFIMGFSIEFDSFKELDKLTQRMSNIEGGNQNIGMMGKVASESFSENYILSSKKFTRKAMKNELNEMDDGMEGMDDMGGMDDFSLTDENGEVDEFAKMFFDNMKYTSIYHFPKKIKSVSNKSAKIKGKTLTIEYDMLEMVQKNEIEELKVKFKRK